MMRLMMQQPHLHQALALYLYNELFFFRYTGTAAVQHRAMQVHWHHHPMVAYTLLPSPRTYP